jgi:hypothetical protein
VIQSNPFARQFIANCIPYVTTQEKDKMLRKILILSAGILLVGLLAVACAQPTPPPPVKETVVVTVVAQATAAPAPAAAVTVPVLADWQKSGHANATAEAFKHWPTETEKEIPVSCAKCHSSAGYRDFLGADGSAAGKVDKAVPPGSVIDCVACHNTGTINKTSVVFPSGITIKNLGGEARCMECHQGRESTVSVNAAIARSAMTTTLDSATSTTSPRPPRSTARWPRAVTSTKASATTPSLRMSRATTPAWAAITSIPWR